jgi:hypothetical protein
MSSFYREKLVSIGLRSVIRRQPPNANRRRTYGRFLSALKLHPPEVFYKLRSHPFSTSTGFVEQEQSPAKVAVIPNGNPAEKQGGNVLVSAAKEAQRLSDLAAKCRYSAAAMQATNNEDLHSASQFNTLARLQAVASAESEETLPKRQHVSEETLQDALEAAQALLIVTSRSSPLQDAIKNKQAADEAIQKQISCLHRAFLAVSSWCLDVLVLSNDKRMLEKALEVSKRAHQLQLPFHVPLYQRLLVSVAGYYEPPNPKASVASLILEIANRVQVTLGLGPLQSSCFFQQALLELVKRRLWKDVVTVLQGMEGLKEKHDIAQLEYETMSILLSALEETVQEDDDSAGLFSTAAWEDQADFLEILNFLNPHLWKSMTRYRSLSDIIDNQNPDDNHNSIEAKKAPISILPPDDVGDDDGGAVVSADTDDPDSSVDALPTSRSETSSVLNRRRRQQEGNVGGHYRSPYFRSMIYQRGHNFPDITDQLQDLNDGELLYYSEDYEREILKEIFAAEEDEDDDGATDLSVADYLLDDDDDDDDIGFPDDPDTPDDFDTDDDSDDSDDDR